MTIPMMHRKIKTTNPITKRNSIILDFCLSCGTKFSELHPIAKRRHMKGHHKKKPDKDSHFWNKLVAKIFLGITLAGAIIGGIIATIISINIGGITIALLWAIPLG